MFVVINCELLLSRDWLVFLPGKTPRVGCCSLILAFPCRGHAILANILLMLPVIEHLKKIEACLFI